MNEQKRLLFMILNHLGITYQYKRIGIYDVYLCRYSGVEFSISGNGNRVNMNKYIGAYPIDIQNSIFCLGENAKKKGYDVVFVDDNVEKHIELNMICSSYTDKQQLFLNICYFLQIISVGKFLQTKSMMA